MKKEIIEKGEWVEPIRFVEINGSIIQYNAVSTDRLENALNSYPKDKWLYLGPTTNPPTIDGIKQSGGIYTHYFVSLFSLKKRK